MDMGLKFSLLGAVALLIGGLIVPPSTATAAPDAKNNTVVRKSTAPVRVLKTAPGVVVRKTLPNNLEFNALGIATPALTDAMSLGKVGQSSLMPRTSVQKPQAFMSGFTFTPSGRVPDDKAFSVGITSRVQGVADGTNGVNISANAPANYNIGFALGYRGFALEGGFNRVARATQALAQGVDVGVSYRGQDWKTSLKVSQEDVARDPYGFGSLLQAPETRRAVEFGGAYAITPGIALTGGLRYQLAYPYDATKVGKRDSSRDVDAGAVFLGTSVSF
jgi:hypothetical protein